MELIEAFGEVVADDGDEAGRQAALRNEGSLGRLSQRAHAPCVGDVFGEVEVVHARLGSGGGDLAGDLEGRRAQHRKATAQRGGHGARVAYVDREAFHRRDRLEALELFRRLVDDGDLVIA